MNTKLTCSTAHSSSWIKCIHSHCCSIEKFYSTLKNALISIAVFVSCFWYFAFTSLCLASTLFFINYPVLFCHPSLCSALLYLSHTRSVIRFNFRHPSHLRLSVLTHLSLSLLYERFSINFLSQLIFSFEQRNVIKPMACKSFKSEIVFKEHFATFEFCFSISFLFCEIRQPKIHSILATSLFEGTIKTTSKRQPTSHRCE